jgi:hypothetical protein
MEVAQVQVFLQDQAGRLAEVASALAAHRIDIRALSLADMTDFGILRLIVSDPERALAVLREAGFTAGRTPVVAVEVDDAPGGLATVLRALQDRGISLRYMYGSAAGRGGKAVVIFRFDAPEAAVAALREAGVRVLDLEATTAPQPPAGRGG